MLSLFENGTWDSHTLDIEQPWENPTYDFPDKKEFNLHTVITGTEGSGHGVYRLNNIDYTVIHGPIVYEIATYHYLYGANYTHNANNNLDFWSKYTLYKSDLGCRWLRWV